MDLGEPYSEALELISLHSISKGIQGECGFRGGIFICNKQLKNNNIYKGYMEMVNVCPKVKSEMLKL